MFPKPLYATLVGLLIITSPISEGANAGVIPSQPYQIEITNASQNIIRIVAIRWLDVAIEKWICQPVDEVVLDMHEVWRSHMQPEIYDGGETGETYVQIRYQIRRNGLADEWSDIEISSSKRITATTQSAVTKIKIVTKRR